MYKFDLDRFPCDVTAVLAEYQHQDEPFYMGGGRVILVENNILIAVDSDDGPKIIFFEEYTISDISEKPEEDSIIYTKSGKMIVFSVDDSCGCGSRLRGWNPYKTLKRLKG